MAEVAATNDGKQSGSFTWQSESKNMWALAWPILVSGVCRFLMAATDTAFVGHIDFGEEPAYKYLAAASLSQMCQLIVLAPPCAFSFAVNPLVAQALGAGNKRLAGMWFQLSLVFGLIANVVPIVLFFFIGDALRLLKFEGTIASLGQTFATHSVYWIVPNLWYQCMRFYFQAQGMPRPAMVNNIIFVFVNFFLNWFFIRGLHVPHAGGTIPIFEGLGFVGAPISLSVSRVLQPTVYAIYMFGIKRAHSETWPGWTSEFLAWGRIRAYLYQAVPNMGTFFFQSLVVQVKTLMIAQLGQVAIAASSAVTNIQSVFAGGVGTCASQVTAIRVGHHLGEGNGTGARKTSELVFYSIMTFVACVALIFTLAQQPLVALMTSDKDVWDLGTSILPIVSLVMLGQMLAQAGNDGVLNAQSRTRLVALLSFGVEIPLSIGGTAFLIFYLCKNSSNALYFVTWGQAAINCALAGIIGAVWGTSDWDKHAQQAALRQEKEQPLLQSDSEARGARQRREEQEEEEE
jgi:MATE family multidrug resistance protein